MGGMVAGLATSCARRSPPLPVCTGNLRQPELDPAQRAMVADRALGTPAPPRAPHPRHAAVRARRQRGRQRFAWCVRSCSPTPAHTLEPVARARQVAFGGRPGRAARPNWSATAGARRRHQPAGERHPGLRGGGRHAALRGCVLVGAADAGVGAPRCFTVRDSGRGIAPELQERLRALLHHRAEFGWPGDRPRASQGALMAATLMPPAPGQGAEFTRRAAGAHWRTREPMIRPSNIPVVEDDAAAERRGLFHAGDGAPPRRRRRWRRGGARAAIEREHFNLVVTDPAHAAMDGLQVLHEVRARRPQTPVLLMTAYGDVDKVVAAMRGGACTGLPDEALRFRGAARERAPLRRGAARGRTPSPRTPHPRPARARCASWPSRMRR